MSVKISFPLDPEKKGGEDKLMTIEVRSVAAMDRESVKK